MGKITHGLSKTRLYAIFNMIKMRCYNPNNEKYYCYGARGITICNEWLNDFKLFYDWAYANGYDENAKYGKCTIDRINVNGNYEPDNCRWTNIKKQCNNRTTNRFITYDNETHTLSEWCDKLNLNYSRVKRRLDLGWNIKDTFNKPKMKNQYI